MKLPNFSSVAAPPAGGAPGSRVPFPGVGGPRWRLLRVQPAGPLPCVLGGGVSVPTCARFLGGMLGFSCRAVGVLCGVWGLGICPPAPAQGLGQSRGFTCVESSPVGPVPALGPPLYGAGFPSGTLRGTALVPVSCLDRVCLHRKGCLPAAPGRSRCSLERLPESTAPQPVPQALLIFTRNLDIHTYKHLKLVPFRIVPTILVLLHFIYNGDLVWRDLVCVGKLEFAGQLRGFWLIAWSLR